jgi:hypothetical protein
MDREAVAGRRVVRTPGSIAAHRVAQGRVPFVLVLYRNVCRGGPALPGHSRQDGAASDGPVEPCHDDRGDTNRRRSTSCR